MPIPSHYNCTGIRNAVFVFGSRPGGFSGTFSDVDIGIEGEKSVNPMVLSERENDLEQSDLPYFADVVDFTNVSDAFKSIAKQY